MPGQDVIEKSSRLNYHQPTKLHCPEDCPRRGKCGVWMWTCHYCGDSGMTIFIEVCQECGHKWCRACEIYSSGKCRYFDFRKVTSRSPEIDNATSHIPVPAPLMRKTKPRSIRSSSKLVLTTKAPDTLNFTSPSQFIINREATSRHITTTEQNIISQEYNRTPPGQTIAQYMPTECVLVSRPLYLSSALSTSRSSTPESFGFYSSSASNLTKTSTPVSEASSRHFSLEAHDMQGEVGNESGSWESEEDVTDPEDNNECWVMNILDSRLLFILGYDLELAARIIPQIHAQIQFELTPGDAERTTVPTQETSETTPSSGIGGNLSSPAGGSSPNSRRRKRGRDPDESEDRQGSGRSQECRRRSDDSLWQGPRFACHFNKKDPSQYSSSRGLQYRSCAGPGFVVLRHLKDHIGRIHRDLQCERCYSCFRDHDELKIHRQAASCLRNSDDLKEGIDDGQWEKIQKLTKIKRGMSVLEKKQREFDVWFEIWDLLFHGLDRPAWPYHSVGENVNLPIIPPSQGTEAFLSTSSSLFERLYQDGIMERNPNIHRHIMEVFRSSFEIHTMISPGCSSSRSTALERDTSEQNSDEQASDSSTVVMRTDESLIEAGHFQSSDLQNRAVNEMALYLLDITPSQPQSASSHHYIPGSPDAFLDVEADPQWLEPISTPNISDQIIATTEPIGQHIESGIDPNRSLLAYNSDDRFLGYTIQDAVQDELLAFENSNFFAGEQSSDVLLQTEDFQFNDDEFNTGMSGSITNLLESEMECGDPTAGQLQIEERRKFRLTYP